MDHPTLLASLLIHCVLLATSASTTASEPSRIWVDDSGLHSVEASLQTIEEEMAVLIRPDGSTVRIPLSRLSVEDTDYVTAWRNRPASQPNVLRFAPPTLPELTPLPLLVLPRAATTLQDGFPLSPIASIRQNKQVGKTELPGPLQADPVPIKQHVPTGSKPIGPIHSYDVCSAPLVIASGEGTFVAFSICAGLSSTRGANANRIVRFDPETKQVSIVWSSDVPITLLDHHLPSGRTLVLEGHQVFGQGGQFAVAGDWDAASITLHEHRSLPASTNAASNRLTNAPTVRWARWVDEEHIVASVDSSMAVWNLVSGELKHWICNVHAESLPAISAGRRYVAVPDPGGVAIYRTSDGKALGRIPVEPGRIASVGFSPRGDSLAIVTPSQLRVWELSTASLRGEAKSRRSLGKGSPVWVDNDLVLSSNGVLLSIFRGVPVWRYELMGAAAASVGQNVGIIHRANDGGFVVATLPHSTASKAIDWVDQRLALQGTDDWQLPGRSSWSESGWDDHDLRFTSVRSSDRR
ncbi:SHD1 domain-containing protein [Novipirellula artificiosorum]|uniref:SLA1 homology domain-containing protein n=1 Tax=Novipirellula artificiosorum TaxID=2528016 RepID=A0A5C6E1S9_9BACT|nr:SHD1 domain-containing protein [Novipirellula artificiosorum]TWU42434.1 hypothetical protein Poly41_07310 [Novipirellula artificiosorum]